MMQITDTEIRIHVPIKFKRKGIRKLIILPEHVPAPSSSRHDATLMNGIAKAWRWQVLYERGEFISLESFSEKYKINKSYAARVMRLNMLAPDIRMAIMDGTQPKGLRLADLLQPFSEDWQKQRKKFGFIDGDDYGSP
jgi:hypothetical protein